MLMERIMSVLSLEHRQIAMQLMTLLLQISQLQLLQQRVMPVDLPEEQR